MNNKIKWKNEIDMIKSDLWFSNIFNGIKFILFFLSTLSFTYSAFYLELISLLGLLTGFITFMTFMEIKNENKNTKSRIRYLNKMIEES